MTGRTVADRAWAVLRLALVPTGSRIAYVRLPAHGTPRPTPVVFLHGGPGIADMAGDAAYFGQLTGDGYAYQFPQSAAALPWADPRPQLARLATPALVIKGSCDYLSWASGVDYRQALPNATLVYLHLAGHNAYQDQPAAFLATVRAFLAGRSLPIAPRAGNGVPADYQGPHGHPIACTNGCPDGR